MQVAVKAIYLPSLDWGSLYLGHLQLLTMDITGFRLIDSPPKESKKLLPLPGVVPRGAVDGGKFTGFRFKS